MADHRHFQVLNPRYDAVSQAVGTEREMFFRACQSFSNRTQRAGICASVVMILFAAASLRANLAGSTAVTPGASVFPGLVPPGANPGTLLASLVSPFSFSTVA